MAKTKSSIRTLYVATVLSGAISACGLGYVTTDMNKIKRHPIKQEFDTTQTELRKTKQKLNSPQGTLRQIIKNPEIQAEIEEARDLYSKEDSLEAKVNQIKSSPEYQKLYRREIVDLVGMMASVFVLMASGIVSSMASYANKINRNYQSWLNSEEAREKSKPEKNSE